MDVNVALRWRTLPVSAEAPPEAATDDAALMRLVGEGDAQARHALTLRLMARIRRLVAALLRNGPDVDDAVQVSWMDILRGAHGFRGDSALETWADRIVVRATLRLARSQRRWSTTVEAREDIDEIAPPATQAGSVAADCDVEAYVATLPEARRVVMLLRHAMGYSIEEIAEMTGASPNTVKDRLLRAREQLREKVRRDALRASALTGGKP